MTRDEIILAAKCCIADNCGACPFMNRGNCITDFMKNVLECIKSEPAPAATGTSSTKKKTLFKLMIAQKRRFVKHMIP